MPFEKFLEARIFQPLGMKDTYIFPQEKHHRMPTAYLLKDGKARASTQWIPWAKALMKFREGAKYPLPEGGVYSTASDLVLAIR